MANVVLNPKEVFEEVMDEPKMADALKIVLISGLVFGIVGLILTQNVMALVAALLATTVQWFVFSGVLWLFEFMFKKKKKSFRERSFDEIASAAGKLWTLQLYFAFVALFSIIFIVIHLPFNFIFFGLFVIAIIALFVAFVNASFTLVKVTLDADNSKAAVVWVLMMILNGLIYAIISPFLWAIV
ncbi:MAG: hypothetical protein AABW59_00670 [archaeon]